MLRNITRAQLATGNIAAAERTAREAVAVAAKAGGQEEPAMLATLAELAYQRGRHEQALSLIERSFAGIDLTKTPMPMRESHATAHRIYRAAGNDSLALAHLEAMKRLDDESTKLATQTSTALMGARFDYANQELRIAQLKAEELRRSIVIEQERARTQRTIFFVTGGAALALLIGLASALIGIRRSRDAVRAANADLAVTNGALGKALAAKTEFLATTSHEIRTPLNGILGMTEVMMIDGTLPAEARERVRLVHGAGQTMRALVDDILDVAKIETGKLTLENAPFDLAEILRDAAHLWRDQVARKGLAFEVAIDLPPGRVLGDGARVRQIVFNLLSNAAKFTEAGSIRLAATRDGERCRVAVSDTGVGIPADKVGEVFESFRQADASTTRRFGGTGLGLSISRNLAQAMGGELALTSVVGEGSTFALTLALPGHVEPVASPDAEPAGDALLIVERNPIMRAMFRSLLADRRSVILQASSVDDALAAIAIQPPREVLIDDGALGDDVERLAAAVADCGAAVTLLRSAELIHVAVPRSWRVVPKPVTGPTLIESMFSDRSPEIDGSALATRAA